MGQQQSKDELLYQQVNYGNVEGIKALCRDGANLEVCSDCCYEKDLILMRFWLFVFGILVVNLLKER